MLGLLRKHPWPDELQLLEDREARGEEFCTPGLGLNATNQDILHICAVGAGEWIVHFHFSEPSRFLGLFGSKRDRVETYDGVATQQVEQMIAQFFLGEQVTPG